MGRMLLDGAKLGAIAAVHFALIAPCFAAPEDASRAEARRHYARGVALYEGGDNAGALVELRQAYALSPSWKLHYDLGLVEAQLDDAPAALRSFREYLEAGGAEVPAARRTEVEGRIKELQQKTGELVVRVDIDGAAVVLDGVALAPAALGHTMVVSPGPHVVSATAEGRAPAEKSVVVAAEGHVEVDLVLAPPEAPPEPAPAPVVATPAASPPPPPPSRPIPTSVWITGGVSVAALATFAGLGIAGTVERSNLQESCAPFCDTTDVNGVRATYRAADVALGIGLVAAGATVVLWLTRPEVTTTPTRATIAGVRF